MKTTSTLSSLGWLDLLYYVSETARRIPLLRFPDFTPSLLFERRHRSTLYCTPKRQLVVYCLNFLQQQQKPSTDFVYGARILLLAVNIKIGEMILPKKFLHMFGFLLRDPPRFIV
jgi:hypothetical protein